MPVGCTLVTTEIGPVRAAAAAELLAAEGRLQSSEVVLPDLHSSLLVGTRTV
ncbi:MAG: hypothetical protein ACRDOK_14520 [Streptosporangiaceae bacterium]